MKRLLATVLAVSLLGTSVAASADGRRHYYYGPQYWSEPSYHYERAPVHYHYSGGDYHSHRGDCDHAYLWIGGAMVLTELIHHAGRH
jgi:hypothetical protein